MYQKNQYLQPCVKSLQDLKLNATTPHIAQIPIINTVCTIVAYLHPQTKPKNQFNKQLTFFSSNFPCEEK